MKIIANIVTFVVFFITFQVSAGPFRLLVPGDTNIVDIERGTTAIDAQSGLIMRYIQLANSYLWTAMVVLAFALVVWIGFKLITNTAGSKDGIQALKKGMIALGVGIAVILFSYTIVRLIINLM